MLFFLSTPEYTTKQFNTTKVRVHLKSGIAEILEYHQDLMGKVENNLVEIETNFENKLEKLSFVLQQGVFVVSNKGLEGTPIEERGTNVYIYAKNAKEIRSAVSIDELTKQYDQKKALLENELAIVLPETGAKKSLTSKTVILQEDVEFLKKALVIAKTFKG